MENTVLPSFDTLLSCRLGGVFSCGQAKGDCEGCPVTREGRRGRH